MQIIIKITRKYTNMSSDLETKSKPASNNV